MDFKNLMERLEYFAKKKPQVAGSAYVAGSAELIGDVRLGENVSVLPQCVLRADINYIEIGMGSNVQDGSIIHLSDDYPVIVAQNVTIGHGAILHACTVEDECLIGMRATILDGAIIGKRSIIGAHALVSKGMVVPPGSLVLGVPGKVTKNLSQEEQEGIIQWALRYQDLGRFYRKLNSG